MLLHSGVLAGTAGFGPANAGVKVRCLTAWRRPNMEFSFQNTIILYRKMCVLSRAFCRKRRSSLKNLFFPLTAALKPIRYTGKRYTGQKKKDCTKNVQSFFLNDISYIFPLLHLRKTPANTVRNSAAAFGFANSSGVSQNTRPSSVSSISSPENLSAR